jgi:murein DD-endopeptidase / murein LD-carboxypeptidase
MGKIKANDRVRMTKLQVPAELLSAHYNAEVYPGAPKADGLKDGANCQVFAYAVLAHFGIVLPPLRSRELWNDSRYTSIARSLEPLDLLLFNRSSDPFGAHLAIYLGEGAAVHLSKSVGVPVEWALDEFAKRPEYRIYIGAKRPMRLNRSAMGMNPDRLL